MSQDNDPLDNLILKDQSADKKLIFDIVNPYIKLLPSGDFYFDKKFDSLTNPKKIIIVLLGRKVINLKKLKDKFKEEAGPAEVGSIFGLNGKFVSVHLARELKGIVAKSAKKYFIPNFNLEKCKAFLHS